MNVVSARGAIAIPAATIARAVATLSEKGYVPRGWLGLMLQPLPQGSGAIVMGIEPKSPAEAAGGGGGIGARGGGGGGIGPPRPGRGTEPSWKRIPAGASGGTPGRTGINV